MIDREEKMKSLLSIAWLVGSLAAGNAFAQSMTESASGEMPAASAFPASSSPYLKRSWGGTEQWARTDEKSAIYPFAKWDNSSKRSMEASGGLPPPAQAVDGRFLAVTLALNAVLDATGAKEYFVKR